MVNLAIILGLILSLCGVFAYYLRKAEKSGQTKQKLKHSEKVIENVKKSKDSIIRLNDTLRRKLRERYTPK